MSEHPSADEIAEMASRGEDVSQYFTNKFTVVRPIRRVTRTRLKACCATWTISITPRNSPEHLVKADHTTRIGLEALLMSEHRIADGIAEILSRSTIHTE